MTSRPKVFLSHQHADKAVTRRIARRLKAQSVDIWLDEHALRIGATLPVTIREQIAAVDAVVVVATQGSVQSPWVNLELDWAREQQKPIIPLMLEPITSRHVLQDHLGLVAHDQLTFSDTLQQLADALWLSRAQPTPPISQEALLEGIRELEKQEPMLSPLVSGFLGSQGLHQDNMDTVYEAPFHLLDEALDTLWELSTNEKAAYHAAYGFARRGAGARALLSWIRQTGDGGTALNVAVGIPLSPVFLEHAIKLLGACNPPNNHALYQFIDRNGSSLDARTREAVVRLVTWPVRDTPEKLADVLAWVAAKAFPEAKEIKRIWTRWIRDGGFDKGVWVRRLARYVADGRRECIDGWDDVEATMSQHVRRLLRCGDKDGVELGLDHLRAAADVEGSILPLLLREADGAYGTAEWDEWQNRDPKVAQEMEWLVVETCSEAQGERNWLRALRNAEKLGSFEK